MAGVEGSPEGPALGGVDPFEQARKAMSLRTRFEGEETASRAPTLPARLVSWSGPSDRRKKHKKLELGRAAQAGQWRGERADQEEAGESASEALIDRETWGN
ncbi:hypothetical protein D1007_28619 [Hordeum vulgare]|nr:hypothetical protein D1007_28619 [Hordeum vulgare]